MTTHTLDASLLAQPAARSTSSARRWAARVITGIPVLFLLFDGVIKLMLVPQVTEATAKLGWPVSVADDLGVVLLAYLALMLWGGLWLRDARLRALVSLRR